MEPLLCFPDPLPSEVALALDRAAFTWKAIDRPDLVRPSEPEDGWAGALICADPGPKRPLRCAGTCVPATSPSGHCSSWSEPDQLEDLRSRESFFDDFCVIPLHGDELGCADRPAHEAGRPWTDDRDDRARSPRAQPRDLPGCSQREGHGPHVHGVRALTVSCCEARARSSPARRFSAGSGATSTTAAHERSTCTSEGSGPSSERSTRN